MDRTRQRELELKGKIRDKSKDFNECFNTPAGGRVLKHLKDEFASSAIADVDNVNTTYFKLGGREVVVYIESMMEAIERLGDE